MKFRILVYPFLIGIYPFVSNYSTNCHEIPPGDLAWPLAMVLAGVAIVWGILSLVLRDVDRAGLSTVGISWLFFSIEQAPTRLNSFLRQLSSYWVQQEFNVWPALAMGLQVALLAILAYLGSRWIKNPRRASTYLNTFTIILLAMPAYEIAKARWAIPTPVITPQTPLGVLSTQGDRPDIYYIIMDGFARADILRELFDYNLDPFLERLEKRGFVIAKESRANYCQTPLSLSSSLNGRYHVEPADDEAAGVLPDPIVFRDNAVVSALRPLGYKFVTFATGFDFTEYPGADLYLTPFPQLSAYQRLMLEGTPVRHFWNPSLGDSYTQTRDRTKFLCETLPKVARIKEPTFTFAHILAPHPPFVFGADGEDVSPHEIQYYLNDGSFYQGYYGDSSSYVQGYRQEVAYLTKTVERAIEGILASSPQPPIIILQSDHGSGLRLNMLSAEKTDHHERMSILNAYYLPGGKTAGLHADMTPVNTFRMVFNNYFGANLPYLPEDCYYSTWVRPLRFVRVTDQVRTAPARAKSQSENKVASHTAFPDRSYTGSPRQPLASTHEH